MSYEERGQPPSSTAFIAAGLDHVRLSYHYLDRGDFDAYGSLLDEDVQVSRPDAPHGAGRDAVVRLHSEIAGPTVRHEIFKVVAQGDCVAVMGRCTALSHPSAAQGALGRTLSGVDFADFFTLSDQGMVMGYRRFYFVPPS
jgi:hypothetical protein